MRTNVLQHIARLETPLDHALIRCARVQQRLERVKRDVVHACRVPAGAGGLAEAKQELARLRERVSEQEMQSKRMVWCALMRCVTSWRAYLQIPNQNGAALGAECGEAELVTGCRRGRFALLFALDLRQQ